MFRIIFILFCLNNVYSQEIVILDSKTKEEIPYVSIKYSKNMGIYTDSKGSFSLTENKSDSIKIHHISYKDTIIKYSEVIDTIYLNSKIESLNEVKIFTGKFKKKIVGYKEKKSTLYWSIKEKTELATLIQYKKKYKKAILNKILIPISKMNLNVKGGKVIESYPNFESVFRFQIYSNLNGKPNNVLLENPILLKCNQNSPNIIEIDISDEYLNFPKEGVFFSVEMIGMINEKGDAVIVKENNFLLPTFKFTNKKRNKITSVSFIKTFFDKNIWTKTEKYNKKIKHLSEYNMAVSLELKIYD